jgi:long-subunit acyl-CoA synthetase (AMP-forming)/GNAT superfamily N-acetyltransferase
MDKALPNLYENCQSGDLGQEYLLNLGKKLSNRGSDPQEIHTFLEACHLPYVNQLFSDPKLHNQWLAIIQLLLTRSTYNFGNMFSQRAERQPQKNCFKIIDGNGIKEVSYEAAWKKVTKIGKSINCWIKDTPNHVIGLFTPNTYHGALIDLSCLSFGYVNVPIPANTSLANLKYILNHARITHLFVDGNNQIDLVQQIHKTRPDLHITHLSNRGNKIPGSMSWSRFMELSTNVNTDDLYKRIYECDMAALATIMYTSGTTANPKGIVFTQNNIISKRFARALALPHINSDDIFLAYLPLYHTFGRFLELMGVIFWGATYCLAPSPTFKSLLRNFKQIKPSVFISIPKRWSQLYEYAASRIPLESASAKKIKDTVEYITGGNLRTGLSAAGYLDPEVFLFFQGNGIELLSGYGMTEATGGILMTPMSDYHIDSVGKPLPGIEVKLADDGEMLIRGPYVSDYYYDKPVKLTHRNNWFHTGDIFNIKKDHYYIIDRKKEIYKNNRGQTIAPQKIENMFQDFDAIQSAFLIGDGREYNSLLIYQSPQFTVPDLDDSENTSEVYFRSLVQSVNSFLVPYERIVNFALVDRDFSLELGERTQKKTYKRNQILKNFKTLIEPMYEIDYVLLIHLDKEIRIPKWLLREKGIIQSDLVWDGHLITVRNTAGGLPVRWHKDQILIGDFIYWLSDQTLTLQSILNSPDQWLGNHSLVEFVGTSIYRIKDFEPATQIQLDIKTFNESTFQPTSETLDILKESIRKSDYSLEKLHLAAGCLNLPQKYHLTIPLTFINKVISDGSSNIRQIAINLLLRIRWHPSTRVRIRVLEYLTPHIDGELFINLLSDIYRTRSDKVAIDELALDVRQLQKTHFESILTYLQGLRENPQELSNWQIFLIQTLIQTLSEYGVRHPISFIWARAEIISWELCKTTDSIRSTAQRVFLRMTNGFRDWIKPPRRLAIDRETGEEYLWKDLIVFDTNVETEYQSRLLIALENLPIVKEAVFHFSTGRLLEIDDIQQKGIWITCLGQNFGKIVFRVLVQTRDNESHNFAVNLNINQKKEFILNEIKWLVVTGSSNFGPKLVEDFGGYWPEEDLYTEEYIPGETLVQYLDRNSKEIANGLAKDRWDMRWLHFIWNGIMAYSDFWNRSNRQLMIADPSPENLIIPEHDYAVGTRLISISNRKRISTIKDLIIPLYENFILKTEDSYPGLHRMAGWEIVFIALFQAVTVKRGLAVLNTFCDELRDRTLKQKAESLGLTVQRIKDFIKDSDDNGVLTKQVVFAALRYERWLSLNPEATDEARGSMLQELYKDYHLGSLLDDYPETRIRFFIMTCFRDVSDKLKEELTRLQKGLRSRSIVLQELDAHLQKIIDRIKVSKSEEYFLTRLLFEHLDAAQYGELISWDIGTKSKLDLITLTLDSFGEQYRIRPPFHPREIAKFYSMLVKSNLNSVFQSQHEFLFVITGTGQLIGGVFWKKISSKAAYLERIVIHENFRKRQLARRLLNELFQRLKDRRLKYITVGFFQARLFYNIGFKINKRFGGLVKEI